MRSIFTVFFTIMFIALAFISCRNKHNNFLLKKVIHIPENDSIFLRGVPDYLASIDDNKLIFIDSRSDIKIIDLNNHSLEYFTFSGINFKKYAKDEFYSDSMKYYDVSLSKNIIVKSTPDFEPKYIIDSRSGIHEFYLSISKPILDDDGVVRLSSVTNLTETDNNGKVKRLVQLPDYTNDITFLYSYGSFRDMNNIYCTSEFLGKKSSANIIVSEFEDTNDSLVLIRTTLFPFPQSIWFASVSAYEEFKLKGYKLGNFGFYNKFQNNIYFSNSENIYNLKTEEEYLNLNKLDDSIRIVKSFGFYSSTNTDYLFVHEGILPQVGSFSKSQDYLLVYSLPEKEVVSHNYIGENVSRSTFIENKIYFIDKHDEKYYVISYEIDQ